MTLVSYTSPHPAGWHNFPTTDSALDAATMQTLDDGVAAVAQAVNTLGTRDGVVPFYEPNGGWGVGNRPATTSPVLWIGTDVPPSGGTTAGGAGSVDGLDLLGVPSNLAASILDGGGA